MGSATRRPSSLDWNVCTWTAGQGGEHITPSRRHSALGSDTTCRTTNYYVTYLSWAPRLCWMLQLLKPVRSHALRSTCTTQPPLRPGQKQGAGFEINELTCFERRSLVFFFAGSCLPCKPMNYRPWTTVNICGLEESLGQESHCLHSVGNYAPIISAPPHHCLGAFIYV